MERATSPCYYVTMPLETPDGVLGAMTAATCGRAISLQLLDFLQALAPQLAQCLAHIKCQLDLQVGPHRPESLTIALTLFLIVQAANPGGLCVQQANDFSLVV